MYTKIVSVAVLALFIMGMSCVAGAVMRPPAADYEPPRTVPAQIHGLSYIAGVRAIDAKKYPGDYRPRVWADFTKKEFALRRQRIDQSTLNSKTRKLEQIDIVRIPYKKILDVWYGEDALKKLAVTNLPTLPQNVWNFRTSSYEPLTVYLDKRYRSPVIVIYKLSRKKRGAVVFEGAHDKSAGVAALLLRHMKKK